MLYRRVLALEPANADLHARVAPLLAETRQRFDAWISFRTAARAYQKQGRSERALATYREAARHLPREPEVWKATARLHRREGRPHEAVEVLLEGSRRFRGRRRRPQAIALLRCVREIEPWHVPATTQLARTLASAGRKAEAAALLSDLAANLRSHADMACVRFAQWRIHPSLIHTWRWQRERWRRDAIVEPSAARWFPISRTRPCWSTTMRSASRMVCSRWAIRIDVRPAVTCRSAS